MNVPDSHAHTAMDAKIGSKLAVLREASRREPYPSLAVRRDRLQRGIAAILANEKRIVAAMNADFGVRPEALTMMAEVVAPVNSMRHAIKNLARWMKPEKRPAMFPLGVVGGRAWVHHQPLGVIGIMVPWNVPLGIGFTGLAGALAAGNRALLKPSELAPHAAEIMAEIVQSAYDASEVEVCQGGLEVAREFAEQPFDHLLYTGGPGVARSVMASAAKNLVPVTLELGGKSPCIVAQGSDLAYAASKVVMGKFGNAGQVCMGVDYAMVHRNDLPGFLEEVRKTFARCFPNAMHNPDYTNIHLLRRRETILRMVLEAQAAGAQIELLAGDMAACTDESRRFPPMLAIEPPEQCKLGNEEIFGPILPVVTYGTLDEAIARINRQTRPLALYFLGGDAAAKHQLLEQTHSGGVTFDDVMLHPMMQDLPFGGVGESGMGRYLGYDGFKTFSNQRGVFQRPWFDISRYWAPPYTPALVNRLRRIAGK
ncbi:MAG TPA: aldehyde dehydrogenase family protein [Macromonas sp.]|nr:aldehyde dehydrogenase family protein [Macromonas sp.]